MTSVQRPGVNGSQDYTQDNLGDLTNSLGLASPMTNEIQSQQQNEFSIQEKNIQAYNDGLTDYPQFTTNQQNNTTQDVSIAITPQGERSQGLPVKTRSPFESNLSAIQNPTNNNSLTADLIGQAHVPYQS